MQTIAIDMSIFCMKLKQYPIKIKMTHKNLTENRNDGLSVVVFFLNISIYKEIIIYEFILFII